MNEIVFIPIPPLAPKILPSEISKHHAKSKCNNFNFEEILYGHNSNNTSFQNFNGVFIKKCLNIEDGLEMLKTPWLVEKFNRSPDTFIVKIEVEGSIDTLDAAAVAKLMRNVKKKFSIILFQTFTGKCQIFWKFEDKLFWLKMDPQAANYVLDFLASSLTNDHFGVPNDILDKMTTKDRFLKLDLLSLIDSRSFNLLMLAAEDGDASVVDSLVQHGFDVNVLVNDHTAIDLAYDNHHFGVVLALLHANSLYPKNFNNSQVTEELRNFISISRELHNSIRQGKQDEVEAIVNENPNLRHFYNTKNLSAASQAVLRNKLEIYEFLLSKSVYIGPKEDFNAILRQVSEKSCESMRGIHLGYIQSSTDNHLMILTVNSFVGHDIPDVDEKLKHITKAFNYLNQVDPLISLILKVVAASRDFKIIFDFHRQSIQHLDPTSSQFTRGVYHTSRHIYIAAQQMLDPDTVHEIYGTMAHELCHYALHLVYHNDCRPYFHDEWDIIERFTRIALLCQLRHEREYLIACVFNIYPKELQHAELIVRVPHMIAEYAKSPQKLEENRQNFPELFQFAENVLAVDMENSLSEIEIHAEDEIKKFAHRVKKQERENFWLWIFSIFCILTLPVMVYVTLWMSDTSKPVYSCANLTDQKFKVMESTVNFQGVPVIYQDLFGNGTDSCKDLNFDEIGRMLDTYDSSQFLDTSDNPYINLSDKSLIQNDKRPDDNSELLDKYKVTNFHQPSLNVSSKVYLKAAFYTGRRVYQKLKGGIPRNVFSFDELKRGKIIIFSDSAGNGKSTTFRHAAWKLKRSLPLHWVSYVDLKDYVEALKAVDLNEADISEFMANKILKLTSEVDRKIFHEKFSNNAVIILWDGVDEISPICTDNILGLIENIKDSTNNKQWIATRVHLENQITRRFKVNPYGLSYYNQTEKLEFIRKFLETNKVAPESAKIIEERINLTISRLESQGKSKNLHNKELNTPLMIRMICDRQLDKFKKENNKNIPSSSLDTENIYTFYEHFIDEHIGIANTTKTELVSLDVMAVDRDVGDKVIHQMYALKEILGATELKDVITEADINLMELAVFQSAHYLTNEQLTRFGILYENSAGQLKFEHRTFAEFFVAQFIFDNLWDASINHIDPEELKLRLQILFAVIKNDEQFKVILDFIEGFLEVKRSRSPYSFGIKVRKIMEANYGQLFHHLDYKANLFGIVTKFFKKDKEIVGKLWKVDENFTFFQESFNFFSDIDYFNDLREIVVDNFNASDQKRILNGQSQQIYILFRIWSEQYNFSDYITAIPNLETIHANLTQIEELMIVKFLEYVDTLDFSQAEFREFFRQTLGESFQYTARDLDTFKRYWNFIERKLDSKDIKLILNHKQVINSQTILFQIHQIKPDFAQVIFSFMENHLENSKIADLLLQRESIENATLMSYDIKYISNFETLELTWNFIKNHTEESQRRQMLSSFNGPIWTLKAVWTSENATTFELYSKIFKDLFTNPELCDMITELIEKMEIYAINSEEHGQPDSFVTTKRREFLEVICEGDIKKLGNINSGIPAMYIR